jgi:tetrahydromethanopterin S-methyltransferase subunit B
MIILALGYLIPLYLIFNLLKKVESLTDQLENLNQEAQDIYEVINKTYTEMKSIDSKEVIFNLRSLYGSTND